MKWVPLIQFAFLTGFSYPHFVQANLSDSSARQLELNEVVISGTLRETSRLSSPIAVETFTPAFFRKNISPALFESLQFINGIQPQINCNVCNAGDIHINGMEGPYTMVLIDGMPMVSGLATVYGLTGIPNSLIERLELVKGPASTLYGCEAVAGIINVITKNPLTTPKLHTELNCSTYGETSVELASKVMLKNASTVFSASYFDYSNKIDLNNDNFTDLALQRRLSVFNKWNVFSKKSNSISLAVRYHFEDRWGGEMQWSKKWKGSDSIYGETITTHRVEALGSLPFSIKKENFKLDFSCNFHQQKSFYGIQNFDAQQHIAFMQMRWFKTIGKHYLLAGLPLRYTYYDDNSPATEQSTLNNKVINMPSLMLMPGIFLQHEGDFHKHFSLLSGIRFDYHRQHGVIFSPRVSFKIPINKWHVVRLSGGNGFRVVNIFTEEHAALSGARQVVISERLNPEQSWSGNLNYSSTLMLLNGWMNMDANGFYTYFSNKIIPDYSDPDKIIFDNVNGYAISRGFSLNSQFYFDNSLSFSLGATFVDVYQINKKHISQRQKQPQLLTVPFSSVFNIGYTIPKIALQIELNGRINSPMHLPVVPNDFRPAKSPWFCIMNIQLVKKFPKGIELYAAVKNLLNFIPKQPILRPFDPFDKNIETDNPFGYSFDTAYNYAPLQGIRGLFGLKWIWE
jgi:outer membrane receptor for ferrienterochelin and colicins